MATLDLKRTVEKKLEDVLEMGDDARSVGVKGNSYRKTRARRNADLKGNRVISTEGPIR